MKRLLLPVVLLMIALLVFVSAAGAQDSGVEAVPVQDARSVDIGDTSSTHSMPLLNREAR